MKANHLMLDLGIFSPSCKVGWNLVRTHAIFGKNYAKSS